jgi:hypothetical protein
LARRFQSLFDSAGYGPGVGAHWSLDHEFVR